MFTYPVFGGAAALTAEWALSNSSPLPSGNNFKYHSLSSLDATPTVTELYSAAMPNVSCPCIATDGTHMFLGGAGGGALHQYKWNGSALVSVLVSAFGGNQILRGIFCPQIPANVVAYVGAEAFGHGLARLTYQDVAPYSYGAKTTYELGNDTYEYMMDFRVSVADPQGYGDTIVTYPRTNSHDIRSFSFSGSTIVTHSSIAASTTAATGRVAWDRDTGLIAEVATSGTALRLLQLNMSTRALTLIGTATLPVSVRCIGLAKGFLVAYGTDSTTRTYTISGTTLNLVDSLAIGFGTNVYASHTSPFTNTVYVRGSTANRILRISNVGAIANIASMGTMGGIDQNGLSFSRAALPTL